MPRRKRGIAVLWKCMKISFDWDSCLAEERQQKIAARFIADGHDVWITTSRVKEGGRDWDNKPVYTVAERLCIPTDRIQFTAYADKWEFLEGFDMHFDDDILEIQLIEENMPSCKCVLILDP